MAKYHINPATGDPGRCMARSGHCPFGGDETHYSTKAEAREAYSIEMDADWMAKGLPDLSTDELIARFEEGQVQAQELVDDGWLQPEALVRKEKTFARAMELRLVAMTELNSTQKTLRAALPKFEQGEMKLEEFSEVRNAAQAAEERYRQLFGAL